MAFMEPEITRKQYWLMVDGPCGIDAIPEELFDRAAVEAILDSADETGMDNLLELVGDYTGNIELYSAELVQGRGVRLSAPGYMDCTGWEVYGNLREAERAARRMARDED